MKKLFLLLLMTNFAVQAQYYSITYIKVSPEKISEFERLENNYWSKIANSKTGQKLIRQGGKKCSKGWIFISIRYYRG